MNILNYGDPFPLFLITVPGPFQNSWTFSTLARREVSDSVGSGKFIAHINKNSVHVIRLLLALKRCQVRPRIVSCKDKIAQKPDEPNDHLIEF